MQRSILHGSNVLGTHYNVPKELIPRNQEKVDLIFFDTFIDLTLGICPSDQKQVINISV